jgi:hypothetical protein
MSHDSKPFLLLAQKYILAGKRVQAWRAAIMAARIAQARHDQWMQEACMNVVETMANI